MKVNLCCGSKTKKGFFNYDKYVIKDNVIYLDCNKLPLPFEDNSIDEYCIEQGLEHLNINKRLDIMNELNRTLKMGCKIIIGLPTYSPAIYHNTYNHTKGYFNPICENNVDEKYNNGLFKINKIWYNKRGLKSIIYYLMDVYRRFRYKSIYYELEKVN